MEDDKTALRIHILEAKIQRDFAEEVKDLRQQLADAEAKAEAAAFLNRQLLQQYTNDMARALQEKRKFTAEVAKLKSWNEVLSSTVSQQRIDVKKVTKAHAKDLLEQTERTRALEAKVGVLSDEVDLLRKGLLEATKDLQVEREAFKIREKHLSHEHEEKVAAIEKRHKKEILKYEANAVKASYSAEVQAMWADLKLSRACIAKLKEQIALLKSNAPNHAVHASPDGIFDTTTHLSSDSCTQTRATTAYEVGSGGWKVEFRHGDIVLDLGQWRTLQDAESIGNRAEYMLLGERATCKDKIPDTMKARMEGWSTLDFFHHLHEKLERHKRKAGKHVCFSSPLRRRQKKVELEKEPNIEGL